MAQEGTQEVGTGSALTGNTGRADNQKTGPSESDNGCSQAPDGTTSSAKSPPADDSPSAPVGATVEEDSPASQKFWPGIAHQLAKTTWLSPRSAVALTGVVVGILAVLGALIAASSTVFSKMVLATYGAHAHQYRGTYIAVLAVCAAATGLAVAVAIFAHRGTGAGISGMGGVNRSRLVEGSSAAERRLDVATYVLVGLFFVLCAVTSFLMV